MAHAKALIAKIARQSAKKYAYHRRNGHGNDANQQGYPGAGDKTCQHIMPQFVRAEPVPVTGRSDLLPAERTPVIAVLTINRTA